MGLVGLLKQVVSDYRSNLVLILPQLLGALVNGLILSSLRSNLSRMVTSRLASNALGAFFGPVSYSVEFLVLVGQVSMTGKVVLAGETVLKDWWDGLRRFFWRVLGIEIAIGIMAVLCAVPFVLAVIVYNWSFHADFLGQPTSYLTVFYWVNYLLGPVTSAILYMCLAPAVVSDLNIGASIRSGWSAAKKTRRAFLVLVGFLCLMEAATYALTRVDSWTRGYVPSLGNTILSLFGILANIIWTLLTPLIILMAFRIYGESSVAKLIQAAKAAEAKVCRCCGGRIPQQAKYCSDCGTQV